MYDIAAPACTVVEATATVVHAGVLKLVLARGLDDISAA